MNINNFISANFSKIQYIDNISNNVNIYLLDEKKYLIKKMETSFDLRVCSEKKKYIDFLYQNGINVGRVLIIFFDGKNVYEFQEYVENFFPINKFCMSQVVALAKYHYISCLYKEEYQIANVLPANTKVCGVHLDKLLVGFEEKYYTYPIRSLRDKTRGEKRIEKLYNIYTNVYNEFKQSYNINDCIIHNDLTSKNMLSNGFANYAFVDFDFSIKSSVYVDLVDLYLTREYNMYDYLNIFYSKQKEIKEVIKLYNENNPVIKLDFRGFVLMAVLKLYSYAFYLHLPVKGLDDDIIDVLIIVGELALKTSL